MMDSKKTLENILQLQDERIEKIYAELRKIMPDYFFKTFSAEDFSEIFPLLVNLEFDDGIQRLERADRLVHVYLKSDKNNAVTSSHLLHGCNVTGAVIHESRSPFVIGNKSGILVIEILTLNDSDQNKNDVPVHAFALDEILHAYTEIYGRADECAIVDLYPRINWKKISDLTLTRLVERLHMAIQIQDKEYVAVAIEQDKDYAPNHFRVVLACPGNPRKDSFLGKMVAAISRSGFDIERAYWRELLSAGEPNDFDHQNVSIASFYVTGESTPEKMAELIRTLKVLYWTKCDDLFHHELVIRHKIAIPECNIIRAIMEFLHSQFAFIDNSAYNAADIERFLVIYPNLAEALVELFTLRFDPEHYDDAAYQVKHDELRAAIMKINSGIREKDFLTRNIFLGALDFIDHTLKTNFYSENKSALSFRLDPSFMKFYENLSPLYTQAFPAMRPFGVFFFYRNGAFGFQIRFSEIARGGWRTVIPKTNANPLEAGDLYAAARDEVFREVYVLAHTQHLKNKDIYEGGSKMIELLVPPQESERMETLFEAQRAILDAFVTLINSDENGKLRDPRVRDLLGTKEIIEIGPDENMFDTMIEHIGKFAKRVGYTLGSGLISGKPGSGINHKEYGVTSFGVYQYFLKMLRELSIDPEKTPFTVKISGGPLGDVAGNFMKLILAKKDGKYIHPELKITAITDGPAAVWDPSGIDRNALSKIVLKANLDAFDPNALHSEGAYIVYSKSIAGEDGELFRMLVRENGALKEKMLTRSEFSLLFQNNLYNYADIFVPCGGRPSTINANNVTDYMPNGKPSSRAIVEGANSFITPDARKTLQQAGIMIIKDASANKCGVITSSYEILSGLMLDEEEFHKVKETLVPEVLDILKKAACREADWLMNMHRSTGKMMTDLTDELSLAINAKNQQIADYLSSHPELIEDEVILSHLPKLFTTEFKDRLARIPAEYRKAIVSVELAARIIYHANHSLESEIRQAINQQK